MRSNFAKDYLRSLNTIARRNTGFSARADTSKFTNELLSSYPAKHFESETSEGEIIIPCSKTLGEKLAHLRKARSSSISFLADFDQTLTKARLPDGSDAHNSFKAIIDYPKTPENVKSGSQTLFDKYFPIERNPGIPISEKRVHLDEWWSQEMSLFASGGYSRADFARMALEGKLLFRKSTRALIETCHNNSIDFVVVSGGVYEFVESSLHILLQSKEPGFSESLAENFTPKIISNRFDYQLEEGDGNLFERASVKDYKLPLITPFSKRQALYMEDGPVSLRQNVVVVGDIIEDARMVRTSQHDCILKVGMLVNAKKPEHLRK